MAISTPDDGRPRLTLPRSLPDPGRLQPYSRADAPFFRSPGFYVRIGGLAALVGVVICLLVLRAWSIQILHGPEYTAIANSQSFRVVDVPGPRAAVVDAKGRLLAGTGGRVVVEADVASLGALDAHGRWHANVAGITVLRRLSRLSHIPLATMLARIARSALHAPFAPAIVLPRPSGALAGYLAERPAEYPGIKVIGQPSRRYPQGAFGSEFLGLLGEVNPTQLGTKRYAHAQPGEIVGQSGIEAVYDSILNPGFSHARVRVDAQGRIAGQIGGGHVKTLPTLRLTIDASVQRAADKAVRDGIALAQANGHSDAVAGAAVAMNPKTGAIVALSSYPTFNQVAAANNPAYRASLYRATGLYPPLYNLATQGAFPTGSTFKPIVAAAALAQGLITPDTPQLCTGSFTIGGFTFHNVEAGVYSSMTLHTALAQSCDTWFYRLGDKFFLHEPNGGDLGIQTWARRLGLGQPTGIDLTGEVGGIVPTPAWLEKNRHEPWYEGQTINLSIGQGLLAATPLQLAVAYSAIANGGTVVRPHVADAVLHGDKTSPLRFPPARHVKLTDVSAIRQGLYEAAHDPAGTSASVFANFPIPVAGKTGTAEAPPGSDHSWYASWAPANDPKLVVVVLIVHGGFGAEAAAPAAKEIYQAYFHVKDTAPSH